MSLKIYDIIKELVQKGINIKFIYNKIFVNKTKNSIFLLKKY